MRARATDGNSLVYTTAPTAARTRPAPAQLAGDGTVRIWLEKKGRKGPVSIIRGLPSDREALVALATRLKRACGAGGSAKAGEIIIQGDHREHIAAALASEGFRVKLAGG